MFKLRRRGCHPTSCAQHVLDAEKAAAEVPSARQGPAAQKRALLAISSPHAVTSRDSPRDWPHALTSKIAGLRSEPSTNLATSVTHVALAALVEVGEPCNALSLTASYGDSEATPAQAVGGCLGIRACRPARQGVAPPSVTERRRSVVPTYQYAPRCVLTTYQYALRCVSTTQCSPRSSAGAATQTEAECSCPDVQSDEIHECQTDTNDCTVFRKSFIRVRLFKTSPIVLR